MPSLKERVHSGGEILDLSAKPRIKLDRVPPLNFSVENCALGNGGFEHLLQAKGLSAKLDAIGPFAVFVPRTLVFDRIRLPTALAPRHIDSGLAKLTREELDDIRHAGKTEAQRAERQGATNECAGTGLDCSRMGALMEQLALDGIEILLPLALDVNERPAPLAERKVLEAGKREKIVFCVHGALDLTNRLLQPVDKGYTRG